MHKKSNHTHAFAGALIVSLSLFPAAAFAQDGKDSRAVVPITVSTHTREGGDGISADSTTTVRMQEGDQKNNNADGNTSGGEQASSTQRHQEGERPSINATDNSGHEADGINSEIEIDQDSANTATTTIETAEHVTTNGELRSFVNHIVKEDSHIADVHVSSSTIETHYETPAKFLWAIPTTLTADVSVKSDGSVTVTYPWWSFFFGTNGNDIAAQLQQSIASSSRGASTTLSASVQAHLLDLLFSTLKSSQ